MVFIFPKRSDKRRGRKKKEIPKEMFEELCKIQCTEAEICAVFGGITDVTLNSWCKRTYGDTFQNTYKELRLGGRTSLRRKQWKLADENATMAIWLGKQYLGQKDKPDEETTLENIIKNITSLAEIVQGSAPNRSIEDLESNE